MARKLNASMSDALMLVGGGVLGAGLALLFAPHSGAKSRKKIARFGKNMSRMSDRMVRSMNDGVSSFADSMGGMGRKATNLFHRG